jgi:RsmE family RNA methyltransferase
VNLLLVDPDEVAPDGTCTIADRRAVHVRTVLGAALGDRLRAGVIGGATGHAEVVADDGAAITLRLALADPPAPPLAVELVLAIPRPKVLSRVIETAAAFRVARIDLTNAWRVDKSYLASPRLAADALGHAARLGAEQGMTTHLPAIAVHRRLMALLDERFATPPARTCVIAHPGAPPLEAAVRGGPVTLAIGPEGGWIDRELATFVARGFQVASLGAPILRVEAAVVAALGQLLLLDRLSQAGPPAG